ncbi:hypothetical protein OGATHE_003239 [Ogataea polymorpha]|uniref:Uncharacterized protein n=1 Tax=Ogataea polymorpha TaxID=460523 RepID=A0A9P8T791_9ASCO|nr:hypothetical protein OGATHE_003239 [Ogataea polymorpha]
MWSMSSNDLPAVSGNRKYTLGTISALMTAKIARDGVCWGPDTEWRDLCRIKPRHAKPADGKERVEHKQQHGRRYGRMEVIFFSRQVHGHRQHGHGDGLTGGTKYHQFPSANSFNQKERNPRGKKILCSVTSGKNTRVKRRHANVALEKRARIVRDQVDTGDLLENLRPKTKTHSVEVSVLALGEQLAGCERVAALEILLEQRHTHVVDLVLHFRVHRGHAIQASKHDTGSLVMTFFDEPSRRFWQLHDEWKNENWEDHLERDREPPCNRACGEVEPEIDPTSDNPADNKMANAEGCALQDGADSHHDAANENTPQSAELVSEIERRKSTGQTPYLVHSNRESLHGGSVRVSDGINRRESVSKRLKSQQRSHDSLVVSEKQESNRSHHTDRVLQCLASQTQEGGELAFLHR